MANIQLNKIILTIVLMTVGASASCSHAPLTPSQTVQHFWTALISGDLENAKRYSTTESISTINDLQKEFASASVSFGKINITADQAKIETTLIYKRSNKDTGSTNFETVLGKQNKEWKVNYVATKISLEDSKRKKGLTKLVDDLQKFGRDASGKLDGVIKNWEEVTPKIKKDLEELGSSMQKQLQDSIDKHGPEIQKKLQEFTESLDDALKDLEKSTPEDKKNSNAQDPDAQLI